MSATEKERKKQRKKETNKQNVERRKKDEKERYETCSYRCSINNPITGASKWATGAETCVNGRTNSY